MTNAIRTDAHSPRNINPAEYRFDRVFFQGPIPSYVAMHGGDAIVAFRREQEETLAYVKAHNWKGGNFEAKRSCDHCGAHFHYGCVFRHLPTDELIVVGHQCADETFTADDKHDLAYRRMAKRVSNMREVCKSKQAIARRKREAFELHAGLEAALSTDHNIVRDIAARFDCTGQLSEKQIALVFKLAREAEERKANPTSEPAWQDVTEGRREMTGTILTVKLQDGYYGSTFKMLVHVDGDQKVWGTLPTSLEPINCDGSYRDALRGKRIRFTATVERSKDDRKFGFFKRPTCAKLI